MKKVYEFFPGVLISFIIYLASEILSKYIPGLGSASLAILIGLVLGNLYFKDKKYAVGTKFCESKLLEYSIVFLGASLTFKTILQLGSEGIIYILILMSGTIYFSYKLAKMFGFSTEFSLLMGAGNAVCGSSAIGASSKVLKSGISETGLAITMVNLIGTLLMFFLPLVIVPIFFSGDVVSASALLGGVLQSVGQVVGGAALVGEDVVKLSAVFKIFRIILLTGVLMLFSYLKSKNSVHHYTEEENEEKQKEKQKLKISIPWYIKGFFLMCLLSSFNLIPQNISLYLKNSSKIFEVTALAAIGLGVKYEVIKKQGPKSLLLGCIIGLFQTVVAIALINILIK
ncbi:MAG: YeiH family protein [Fusobacteriaceae bacterium]